MVNAASPSTNGSLEPPISPTSVTESSSCTVSRASPTAIAPAGSLCSKYWESATASADSPPPGTVATSDWLQPTTIKHAPTIDNIIFISTLLFENKTQTRFKLLLNLSPPRLGVLSTPVSERRADTTANQHRSRSKSQRCRFSTQTLPS